MRLVVLFFIFISVSNVWGAERVINVSSSTMTPDCQAFLTGLRPCKAGQCTNTRIENNIEKKYFYKSAPLPGGRCQVDFVIEDTAKAQKNKMSCQFNRTQRNHIYNFLEEMKSKPPITYSSTDCSQKDRSCRLKIKGKEMINVFKLGFELKQCKI